MTRILLDTSAYSALFRGLDPVSDAVRRAAAIHVNPVVLGELRAGFMRGAHRRKNEDELRLFLASPRVSVLPLDEETAERYAEIVDWLSRRGTPIPTNDLWIAASASQHGLRVVTTDEHYTRVPQIVVDHFALR